MIKKILKQTTIRWYEHNALLHSAALAFYAMLSLPSLMIIVVAITQYYIGPAQVQALILHAFAFIFDKSVVQFFENYMDQFIYAGSFSGVSVFSVVVLFISASALFMQLQSTINELWGVEIKTNRAVKVYIVHRLLAIVMIFSSMLLLVFSLFSETILMTTYTWLGQYLPKVLQLFRINQIISILVIFIVCIIIFKVLPDVIIAWRDVIVGALVSTLLFMLGKIIITFYLLNVFKAPLYGAPKSLIIILLWVYLSSMIVFWGAEFTFVYAQVRGHKIKARAYSKLTHTKLIKST